MKFPHPSMLRQSADAAPLPMALVVVLALALLFQLLAPVDADLPEMMIGRGKAVMLRPVTIVPIAVAPAMIARAPFAPAGGNGQSAQTNGGTLALLGVARSGGRGAAVLRGADGMAQTVTVGGTIGPWRVTGIGASTVRLTSEARTVILRIGQSTGDQDGGQ